MKSKEYIIKRIRFFSCRNNAHKISYWCSENGNNHFIEVIPDSGDRFINEEIEFLDNFNDRYPNENIGFITTDDLKFLKQIKLIFSVEPIEILQWASYSISDFVLDLAKLSSVKYLKYQSPIKAHAFLLETSERYCTYSFEMPLKPHSLFIEAESWDTPSLQKRGMLESFNMSLSVI